MAEQMEDRMKGDVLFAEALKRVANTEQVGYLGDPVIVESLLRTAIGDVMRKMTEATPPDERVQAVMSKSEEIGVILLGGSKHYSPMRNWNLPGKIDVFCAKWMGLADPDPVTRMKHALVKMFNELGALARYAGTKGVMPEQWKWQVDAIVQKYTSWFVGIDTPTQAIM